MPAADRRPAGPRARLLPALLLLLLAAAPARGDAGDDAMQAVVSAWKARNAGKVVASLPNDASVTLRLLEPTPPVAGSFRKAQAEQTLKDYFRKVDQVRLTDVTSADHRDAAGYRVRYYEYTYRPAGRDPVTTRLVITLRAVGEGRWQLDSVSERPAPRDRDDGR